MLKVVIKEYEINTSAKEVKFFPSIGLFVHLSGGWLKDNRAVPSKDQLDYIMNQQIYSHLLILYFSSLSFIFN